VLFARVHSRRPVFQARAASAGRMATPWKSRNCSSRAPSLRYERLLGLRQLEPCRSVIVTTSRIDIVFSSAEGFFTGSSLGMRNRHAPERKRVNPPLGIRPREDSRPRPERSVAAPARNRVVSRTGGPRTPPGPAWVIEAVNMSFDRGLRIVEDLDAAHPVPDAWCRMRPATPPIVVRQLASTAA